MKNRIKLGSFLLILAVIFALNAKDQIAKIGDVKKAKKVKINKALAEKLKDELIKPIPLTVEDYHDDEEIDYDENWVKLGKRLFHDTRLSSDDSVSCASCHDLRYGGVDRAITATGIHGQIGPINTPTVFNSSYGFTQFWDGRAEDLEKQADGPPNAPNEMGSNWKEILEKIRADKIYLEMFKKAVPDEVKKESDIKEAHLMQMIAAFERTLITPNADFDKYLRGQEDAISEVAKKGYEVFKDKGCIECHNGAAVGGKSYQKLGRKKAYFTKGTHTTVDLGRYNVTKKKKDKFHFKVPTLRNIELTAPYFHDGSQKTLRDAVVAMSDHQIDIPLDDKEVDQVVEFLKTLTGEYQGKSLKAHQNTHATKK